jgi:hypothetical protein
MDGAAAEISASYQVPHSARASPELIVVADCYFPSKSLGKLKYLLRFANIQREGFLDVDMTTGANALASEGKMTGRRSGDVNCVRPHAAEHLCGVDEPVFDTKSFR